MSEDRPIKLYFAILNHGWLRREVVSHQLPLMQKTPGVKLMWEDPAKTYHHPIYSNRNKIVKRFLKSDCDFLMMQDDDIIPVGHNPAELVFANKDIIGCPAKVRSDSGTLDWVAYTYVKDLGGYTSIDMALAPSWAELLKVDIVGTGLICIRRNVLEDPRMKAAFTVENDEDGICEWGTDFAFCKRAGKAGFEIYTTPFRTCEHIKEMGLTEIGGYDDSDNRDQSNYKYNMAWGNWAIQQQDWRFIKDAMDEYGVKNVLEFGAGLSSLLMSERANVVTYETDPDWAAQMKAKANGNALAFEMWDGKSAPGLVAQRGPFDMAFIDGPKAILNGGPGREVAYKTAVEAGVPLIITHDSGRPEEQSWAASYLRPKYDLVRKNGHHQTRCELWKRREATQ